MAREMKDSGIEWIGEIPIVWQCVKLGLLYSFFSGDSLTAQDFIDEGTYDVYGANGKRGKYNKYNVQGKHILIGRVGALCGNIHLINDNVWVTEHALISKKLSKMIMDEFSSWLLRAMDLGQYASGTAQPVIAAENIRKLRIPVPSFEEQKRIACVLDLQCVHIDAIIEQTRASIEEYKKLKQAVITQAVTKGIRPDRQMKDSGIEWIGEIPEDWEIVKFKTIITIIESGTSVNAAQYAAGENETGVLKTSCVSKFFFNPSENKAVNDDELHRVTCPVKADTIIMSRMNTPDLVGACGFVDKDYHNLYLPDRLWQIHFTKKANVKFLWYYLNSRNIRNYYASLAVGTSSSMQNISQDQFYNTYAMIPSEDEQYDIVDFLDGKIEEIDKLVVAKEQLVIDLESYKRSLIYEYVTGKKEVPVCQ